MRKGQSVAEIHSLVSDPEVRVALVPISEADYENSILQSAELEVPDNMQGARLRDKYETVCQLVFACRHTSDITEQMWSSPQELMEDLNPEDVNYLIDHYFEMVDQASPSIDGVPEEELDTLKKALQEMDWSVLYGKQWYALKRFLLSLMPEPLGDSLLGVSSINSWITKKDEPESIPDA